MIDGKTFIEEIEELMKENKLTKMNGAAFIGQCNLLADANILSNDQWKALIDKIQHAAGMTDEEVDEALFYRRGDDK